MKKTINSLMIMLILFSTIGVMAQNEGDLITKTHSFSTFTELEMSGVFDITLEQADNHEVTITARQKIHDIIKLEQSGNELSIRFKNKKNNIKNHKKIKIHIRFKDLEEIETSMVGDLMTANTLHIDKLELESSSVGKTKLDIQAKKLEADLSCVGNVDLKGKVEQLEINSSIVGELDAEDLMADYVDIDNSSVGSVRIYARQEIDIDHSGIGRLTYYGQAQVVGLDASGIGKVKKGN